MLFGYDDLDILDPTVCTVYRGYKGLLLLLLLFARLVFACYAVNANANGKAPYLRLDCALRCPFCIQLLVFYV